METAHIWQQTFLLLLFPLTSGKWGENDADVMRVPVISKLLDTTDYDRPVGGIEWREGISSGSISYGLEIVNIEGLEQQGLQICYLAPQEIAGQKNFKTRTIYWDCGVWRVCQ